MNSDKADVTRAGAGALLAGGDYVIDREPNG
jgi:hypothetical protein